MSVEFLEAETTDSVYDRGYNDGYEGRLRASEDPSYLEGYYDGVEESEEADDYENDGLYFSEPWED